MQTPEDTLTDQEIASFNPPLFWLQNRGHLYGNNQKKFAELSYRIVCTAAQRIKEMRKTNTLNESSFQEILNYFATERRNIAQETGTVDAKLFGKNRQEKINDNIYALHTDLHAPRYRHLQESIKNQYLIYLKKYRDTGKTTFQTELSNSRVIVTILPLDLPKILKEMTQSYKNYEEASFNAAIGDLMTNSEQIFSDFGQQFNLTCNNAKIIKLQYHIKVDDKWIPTTQYYSIYFSFNSTFTISDEELKAYQLIGIVTCIHTDPEYFMILMKNIAGLWLKAANWDGNDTNQLKEILAEIHYKKAHMVLYYGGSAAIAEYIEKSLLKSFDFLLTPVADDLIDLASLKQPYMHLFIRDFVNNKFWNRDPTAIKCEISKQYTTLKP